jgi:c-di-GMP-binding flagellar brake protein YcgR
VLRFWQGLGEGRTKIEKRKYPRVKISNTISYVGSDENGTVVEQCMGVIKDISQNGLLIESLQAVESKDLSLMASTQKNKLIKIKGKVVSCRKDEFGKFKTGILLEGTHEENVRFVRELIRAYHYQKK